MRTATWTFFATIMGAAAWGDSVVAVRTLPAGTVITGSDVEVVDADGQGAATQLSDVVGLETRRTIYAGRAVDRAAIGEPAIVERNQIVPLNYHRAGLAITTEGRSLGRGAEGERVRVLNLDSRETVSGVVRVDGSVSVEAY